MLAEGLMKSPFLSYGHSEALSVSETPFPPPEKQAKLSQHGK
jgi:hypothetical protein